MTCAPSHDMPAQYTGGRHREHDRQQIAKDLIEWARKDTSINLNEFCCTHDPIIVPSKLSQWAKDDDFFRQAYESAKAFIGYRRERKLSNNELHVKAYDLNATTYDYFLKEERMAMAKYESSLKAQENVAISEAEKGKLDAFIDAVNGAQARNSSLNKSNVDSKS